MTATPVKAWRRPRVSASVATRSAWNVRGGSSPSDADINYPRENNPLQQQQQQQYSYEPPFDSTLNQEDPYHETVQERVEAWKHQQALHQQEYQASPRDAQGRVKLLTSVGKGSRALIFFLLLWRTMHLYEVADQSRRGWARLVLVTPLMFLFVGNLLGVVFSLSTPGHAAKRRLKAILNLDKLVETVLLLYCFGRLTLFPSKYVDREIFISNIFHSILFLLQCQAFTRLSWDEQVAPGMHTYQAAQQQRQPSYVEQNPYVNNRPQTLGDVDDEDNHNNFPYDNPYSRSY